MKAIVCSVCDYVVLEGLVQDNCPACGCLQTKFELKEEAVKTAANENIKNETEEKHTPVITLSKQCGLITGVCTDISVKIGSVLHPMLPEHYITRLDLYKDRRFISRVTLSPMILNPAITLHLKGDDGTLSVIARCNIHGLWMAEIDLK
ncbi:MAG: desulfoferrodoxin family protein [Candidatus Margulisiibacteriota bacterium]